MADHIAVDHLRHRPVLRAERYILETRLSYEECMARLRSRIRSRRDVPLWRRTAVDGKALTGWVGTEGFSVRLRERWFRQNTNPYRPIARGRFEQAAPGTRIEVRIGLGGTQVLQLMFGLVGGAFILIAVLAIAGHLLAQGPRSWWIGLPVVLFLAMIMQGWRQEQRETLAGRDRLLAVLRETLDAHITASD